MGVDNLEPDSDNPELCAIAELAEVTREIERRILIQASALMAEQMENLGARGPGSRAIGIVAPAARGGIGHGQGARGEQPPPLVGQEPVFGGRIEVVPGRVSFIDIRGRASGRALSAGARGAFNQGRAEVVNVAPIVGTGLGLFGLLRQGGRGQAQLARSRGEIPQAGTEEREAEVPANPDVVRGRGVAPRGRGRFVSFRGRGDFGRDGGGENARGRAVVVRRADYRGGGGSPHRGVPRARGAVESPEEAPEDEQVDDVVEDFGQMHLTENSPDEEEP